MGILSPSLSSSLELLEAIGLPPERCDAACPAEAQVHMTHDPDGELMFCLHHFREHARALRAAGWQRVNSDLGALAAP